MVTLEKWEVIHVTWEVTPVIWEVIHATWEEILEIWEVIQEIWEVIQGIWEETLVTWEVIPVTWEEIPVTWETQEIPEILDTMNLELAQAEVVEEEEAVDLDRQIRDTLITRGTMEIEEVWLMLMVDTIFERVKVLSWVIYDWLNIWEYVAKRTELKNEVLIYRH